MKIDEIFNKRILFMTGKGGVGKTTLACAVAFAARDMGKRVCLVEVSASSNLRYIFNRDIPVYEEVFVAQNLSVLTLEPFKAMSEYVQLQLKVPWMGRLIMGNPIVNYFLQSAPGWRELVIVGKIWHMQNQTVGRLKKPLYDLIVVDAPATGHGLSFLSVPSVFMNIFKFGRMQGQNKDLQAMLTDPARSVLNVVTLPEEMAVNEAKSLVNSAKNVLGMATGIAFVNGMRRSVFDPDEKPVFEKLLQDVKAMDTLKQLFRSDVLLEAAEAREKRAMLSQSYLERVRNEIGPPIVEIPQMHPGRVDLEGVKKIAEIIKRETSGGGGHAS